MYEVEIMNRKHLLYIPTNRDCKNAIEKYLDECRFISGYTGEEVYFALIESNSSEIAKLNSFIIQSNSENIKCIDFTYEKQKEYIESLLGRITDIKDSTKQRLYSLLLPSGINYSAGPNKAALLASSLGVTILHRRDSDTYPQIYDGKQLFPSKIECDCILSSYSSKQQSYNNDTIYFIGSNYLGEAPIDYDEIMQISPEFVYRIKQLENPTRSLQSIISRVQEYFDCPNEHYSGVDQVIEDRTGLSEMGNCCTGELFLYLPEMPVSDILGCDYMQKNVLYRLNYPIVYHNRKVQHLYYSDRNTKENINQFIDYNLRDVRFKLMMRIRNRHNAILKENRQLLISKDHILNTKVYIDAFKQAALEITPDILSDMINKLSDVYYEVSKAVSDSRYNKYDVLSKELISLKQQLINDIYSGIDNYCILIEHWEKLILAAKSIDVSFL